MPHVIVAKAQEASRSTLRRRDPEATSASLVALIGAAFAAVGITDLVLLWTPLRLGNAVWEFGTLSRTFDNIPMTALGFTLVAYGLVRHPERSALWLRGAASVFGLVGVVLLAMAGLYVLAAPPVIGQTPPEGMEALGRAIVKNGVEIAVYTVAFWVVAIVLWRGAEKAE